MNLIDFEKGLLKLKNKKQNFDYFINPRTDFVDFVSFEKENSLIIPEKIKEFYQIINGFETKNPLFEMLPLEKWIKNNDGFIHFATFNNCERIGFDTNRLNTANQWTIVNLANRFELTLSMSSFWSNKIWHWLKDQKKIWEDDFWNK